MTDFPRTFAEDLQSIANAYVKKWAGMAKCGTNPIILYMPKKSNGLGVINLEHYYENLGLVREHLLKYSGDPVIVRLAERRLEKAKADRHRKWHASVALVTAERGLALDAMAAEGQTTRAGIGFGRQRRGPSPKVGSQVHRERVVEWHKERSVEEQRRKLGELQMQGDWAQWKGIMNRDLSWTSVVYRLRQSEVKFLFQSMSRVAPTPDQLRRMGYLSSDRCTLCARPRCDLLHVLSYCEVALEQGRYTWRHNEVLRVLHFCVGRAIRATKKVKRASEKEKSAARRGMVFVKEGDDPRKHEKREKQRPILETADDWRIMVDLPAIKYQFPSLVAVTGKRPDLVLSSASSKRIVLVELTVPAERNVMQAFQRKMLRYDGPGALASDCRDAGMPGEDT